MSTWGQIKWVSKQLGRKEIIEIEEGNINIWALLIMETLKCNRDPNRGNIRKGRMSFSLIML